MLILLILYCPLRAHVRCECLTKYSFTLQYITLFYITLPHHTLCPLPYRDTDVERSNRLPNVVTAPAPLSRLAVSRTVLTACSSASFYRTKSSVKTDSANAVTGGLCPQRPKQVKAVSDKRCERRQSSLVAVGRVVEGGLGLSLIHI